MNALLPCATCGWPTPTLDLHDEHEPGCAQRTALLLGVCNDEVDCTCPEVRVCPLCCTLCAQRRGLSAVVADLAVEQIRERGGADNFDDHDLLINAYVVALAQIAELRREVLTLGLQLTQEIAALAARDRDVARLKGDTEHLRATLRELIDPNPCRYDHDNICQTHWQGKYPCPHERAKAAL